MIELLKPFTSARQFAAVAFSWGLPVGVALAVYSSIVFPSIESTRIGRDGANAVSHAGIRPWWFLIGLLIVLTVGLSAVSRWIYQILEGISWPHPIREARERTHCLQWAVLTAEKQLTEAKSRLQYADQALVQVQEASDSPAGETAPAQQPAVVSAATTEWQEATLQVKCCKEALDNAIAARNNRPHAYIRRERPPFFVLHDVRHYPARERWVRATRFGNRIASFEKYGIHRYELDPLALWYELTSAAPESLTTSVQDARQGVELWVGTWTAAVLLGGVCIVTEILAAFMPSGHSLITPLVVAVLCWAAATTAYRIAAAATEEWHYAVTALVNLGRRPLAKAYGLELPESVVEEKVMWQALRGYVITGTDAWAHRLDRFRTKPDDSMEPQARQASDAGSEED